MPVPGYEHHTFRCPGCGDEERRLVFSRDGGTRPAEPEAPPTVPPAPGGSPRPSRRHPSPHHPCRPHPLPNRCHRSRSRLPWCSGLASSCHRCARCRLGVAPDQDASISQSARTGVALCRSADRRSHSAARATITARRADNVSRNSDPSAFHRLVEPVHRPTAPPRARGGVTLGRTGLATPAPRATARRAGGIRHGAACGDVTACRAASIPATANRVGAKTDRNGVAVGGAGCRSRTPGRDGQLADGTTDNGRIRTAAGIRRRGSPAARRHRAFPPPDPGSRQPQ